MTDSIKITIPSEGFAALGKVVGTDLSILSPFRVKTTNNDTKPPKEVMRGNKVKKDLLPLFQTLANTQSMGSCAYLGTQALVNISFYYPLNGTDSTPPVSLSMADEGIRMESPPDVENVWILNTNIPLEFSCKKFSRS